MVRLGVATAVLPSAGGVARLLAVLVTLAVLLATSPLPLIGAVVAAAPVGEETDTDVESVSSACPRRANGASGPPFEAPPPTHAPGARLPAGVTRSSVHFSSAPVGRSTFRPHPRC